MNTKQVIVMRNDLNMRKGKQIAQGSHSSISFLTKNVIFDKNKLIIDPKIDIEILKSWMDGSFTKICVRVDSEEELLEIYQKAIDCGLPAHLITDAGFTEFHGVPTKTCVAIGPYISEEIDKITGHLKLL